MHSGYAGYNQKSLNEIDRSFVFENVNVNNLDDINLLTDLSCLISLPICYLLWARSTCLRTLCSDSMAKLLCCNNILKSNIRGLNTV